MAQQIINIGAAPNDGTGDALRVAFNKANDNFSELYTAVASFAPLTLTAATALSGHRVVVATAAGADYADVDNPAHAEAVLGITANAALAGDPVTIIADGEMSEPSWNWTPGAMLFVAASGALSETPPVTGWIKPIAIAMEPTRILIANSPAIHQ